MYWKEHVLIINTHGPNDRGQPGALGEHQVGDLSARAPSAGGCAKLVQQRARERSGPCLGFPPAPYPTVLGWSSRALGLGRFPWDAVGARVLLARLGSCGYCHRLPLLDCVPSSNRGFACNHHSNHSLIQLRLLSTHKCTGRNTS